MRGSVLRATGYAGDWDTGNWRRATEPTPEIFFVVLADCPLVLTPATQTFGTQLVVIGSLSLKMVEYPQNCVFHLPHRSRVLSYCFAVEALNIQDHNIRQSASAAQLFSVLQFLLLYLVSLISQVPFDLSSPEYD